MKLGQLSKVTWAFKVRAVNPGEIVCSVQCSKCQQNPCLSMAPVCILDNGVGSGMWIALSLWLVSLQSKARIPRLGTKNHLRGHIEQKCTVSPTLGPGEAGHGKEAKSGVKGHYTPPVLTASLQGPARGTQATGPVPAANNGDTGQLCPQDPQSI